MRRAPPLPTVPHTRPPTVPLFPATPGGAVRPARCCSYSRGGVQATVEGTVGRTVRGGGLPARPRGPRARGCGHGGCRGGEREPFLCSLFFALSSPPAPSRPPCCAPHRGHPTQPNGTEAPSTFRTRTPTVSHFRLAPGTRRRGARRLRAPARVGAVAPLPPPLPPVPTGHVSFLPPYQLDTSRPSSRTNRTRLVPPPVGPAPRRPACPRRAAARPTRRPRGDAPPPLPPVLPLSCSLGAIALLEPLPAIARLEPLLACSHP